MTIPPMRITQDDEKMLSSEVVESAERRVGATLCGKWHLDRVIGVGGMAAVYEATHRNRNRVAIKLLHPALSLEEGTRQRFLREGYVANTIRHEGAVQVLDDDVTDDGFAFLVMELLKGESVEERMHRKGGALDIREALKITDQLLEVLEAAHDQDVVHRDIKPDNLFLTEEGKLKVLDFGIARLNQGDGKTTKVGSFMGTPAFCAQEQARGRWDEVDHRTDLYSVGASLFTCITGTHVHEAETSSEQLALAIGATARSLSDVMPDAPKELVDLVDTALAYDKEDRFQSARAMRAAVKRVLAGLPVEKKVTTPPPPPGALTFGPHDVDPDSMPPQRLSEQQQKFRIVVGVLAAALLAVLIFFIVQPTEPPEKAAAKEESPDASTAQKAVDQEAGSEKTPSEAPLAQVKAEAEAEAEASAPSVDLPSEDAAPEKPRTQSSAASRDSSGQTREKPSEREPNVLQRLPQKDLGPSSADAEEDMFTKRF
jgi:serine/threonine protein kinase